MVCQQPFSEWGCLLRMLRQDQMNKHPLNAESVGLTRYWPVNEWCLFRVLDQRAVLVAGWSRNTASKPARLRYYGALFTLYCTRSSYKTPRWLSLKGFSVEMGGAGVLRNSRDMTHLRDCAVMWWLDLATTRGPWCPGPRPGPWRFVGRKSRPWPEPSTRQERPSRPSTWFMNNTACTRHVFSIL